MAAERKPVIPWTCFECGTENLDQKLKKCESCKTMRLTRPKAPEDPAPKSLIRWQVQKTIDGGDGEGTVKDSGEQPAEDGNEEIKRLEAAIEHSKALGLKAAAEEAEKKLEEARTFAATRKKESNGIDEARAARDIMGET